MEKDRNGEQDIAPWRKNFVVPFGTTKASTYEIKTNSNNMRVIHLLTQLVRMGGTIGVLM